MANKAELVDRVKQVQRSDPEAKQQWWEYCDTRLGGIKDPNRHDAAVLEDFLVSIGVEVDGSGHGKRRRERSPDMGKGGGYGGYGKGGYDAPGPIYYPYNQPPPSGHEGWGGYGGYGGGASWGGGQGQAGDGALADMIKTGQRRSPQWKAGWQSYCCKWGNGFTDPARYEETFLLDFLDYIGNLLIQDMGPAPLGQPATPAHSLEAPIGSGKRPAGGAGQPPAKRQAINAALEPPRRGGGYSPAGNMDKAELVDKVKALQRTNPDAKTAWWAFCDESQQGIKDPNRHDASVLLKFLQGWE